MENRTYTHQVTEPKDSEYYQKLTAQNLAFAEKFEVLIQTGTITPEVVEELLKFFERNQEMIDSKTLSQFIIDTQVRIRQTMCRTIAKALDNNTRLIQRYRALIDL